MHNDTTLRKHAIVLLFGYALQFLAGMLLNLFVTIPTQHPGDAGSNYFIRSAHSLLWALSGSGGWELTFHAYLALLLLAGSTALFVRALILHNKEWAISGGLAALITSGALFNGLSFVDFNHNHSSMIMAACWLGAVGVLVFSLIRSKKIH
jgi:hypothetical protein